MKKKALLIGTLPPPIDGMSKTTLAVFDALNKYFELDSIDLSRPQISRNFNSEIIRVIDIFKIYLRVLMLRKDYKFIYMTVSESRLGNFKDIILYFLLFRYLDKLTIHMLGGTGMITILNEQSIQSKLNKFFMKRMRNVIVEGNRGYDIFGSVFHKKNINVVPNFVDDYLYITNDQCKHKFQNLKRINIIYLSNMIPEKGYEDLLNAIDASPTDLLKKFKFNFVGGFQNEDLKSDFNRRIKNLDMVNYLGEFIDGNEKKNLFMNSHIFILPTYYPYEGQPISIMEAYSTGCAVISTNHAGIPDIFKDGVNGYLIEKQSPESIVKCFQTIALNREMLELFAKNNLMHAESMHKKHRYQKEIVKIFTNEYLN